MRFKSLRLESAKKYLAILTVVLATAAPVAFSQTAATPRAQVIRIGGGPWMGVSVLDVNEERVKELKLKEERGVEVVTVAPDGPAQKAGLKEHDVILDYNGQRVEGVEEFRRMISETPEGRNVKLVISRDGATQTVSLKLEERAGVGVGHGRGGNNSFAWASPTPPSPPTTPPPGARRTPRAFAWDGDMGNLGDLFWTPFGTSSPRLGIEGEEITGQLGEYFGVPERNGILVREVHAGSAAERAGLKAGDVITKINGKHVQDMGDLRDQLRDNAGKSFPITLIRNKKETTVTVTVEKVENRIIDRM